MAHGTPDVSFVVIGFNESANVEQCLGTIFAQRTPCELEVLVVDDASTDDMAARVTSLEAAHHGLRLLRHPTNLGRGAARRTGQDASHGDAVAFIDADIRLPDDWLERARVALEGADAVSGVAVPDGDVAVIWRMFHPVAKGLGSSWGLTGNNVLIRRTALERVGWPAERRRSEDNRMATAMRDAGLVLVTLGDLRVEHHEAKTYRRTLAHTYGTGYHANEVLRDLRRLRLPDLAWLGWLAAVAAGVLLAIAGVLSAWAPVVVLLGATLVVDAAAMAQRFSFTRAPMRWLAATLAYLPLMGAYLVSRTLSSPRLLLRRSTPATPQPSSSASAARPST